MPKRVAMPRDLMHNKKVTPAEAVKIAQARKAFEDEIDAAAGREASAMRRIGRLRPARSRKYARPGSGTKGR